MGGYISFLEVYLGVFEVPVVGFKRQKQVPVVFVLHFDSVVVLAFEGLLAPPHRAVAL